MIQDINEYIKKPQLERQSHIDLELDCVILDNMNMQKVQGALAQELNTDFPRGNRIHACHACNNKLCSNIKHIYWGTATENANDRAVEHFKTKVDKKTKHPAVMIYLDKDIDALFTKSIAEEKSKAYKKGDVSKTRIAQEAIIRWMREKSYMK